MDTLRIDSLATSFNGLTAVGQRGVYFLDELFCWLYRLDAAGKPQTRLLGQGRSNREVPVKRIDGYAVLPDEKHCLVGGTHDIYLFDSAGYRLRFLNLKPAEKKQGELPAWERFDVYSLCYDNLIVRFNGNRMFLNVMAADEIFNLSTPDYSRRAHILMEVDALTGEAKTYLGHYSPAIGTMTAFWGVHYNITPQGDFFVGYEADSLIYVYDESFRALRSFGRAGREMRTAYRTLEPGPQYKRAAREERREKGFYTSLRRIDDRLLRTYCRGGDAPTDGLQIYDGTTLIADVDVPRGMKIAEYIEPYYYSQIVTDDENETLTLYRFKLDK